MNFKTLILLPLAIVSVVGIADAKSKISKPTPLPESLVAPGSVARREGPEVPFPLSSSLPFPWSKIEGIWEGRVNGRPMLFSFDVQVDYDGNQLLKVMQLDGTSGVVVSDGVGMSGSSDNLVRAAMYGAYMSDSYMLFIGSYRNTKISPTSKKPVTVLTLRAFGEMNGDSDEQIVVKKLSSVPYQSEY